MMAVDVQSCMQNLCNAHGHTALPNSFSDSTKKISRTALRITGTEQKRPGRQYLVPTASTYAGAVCDMDPKIVVLFTAHLLP